MVNFDGPSATAQALRAYLATLWYTADLCSAVAPQGLLGQAAQNRCLCTCRLVPFVHPVAPAFMALFSIGSCCLGPRLTPATSPGNHNPTSIHFPNQLGIVLCQTHSIITHSITLVNKGNKGRANTLPGQSYKDICQQCERQQILCKSQAQYLAINSL